ncbi:MAG TPA: DUF5916 domain-containing protein [Chitinophagaceae bacterium]
MLLRSYICFPLLLFCGSLLSQVKTLQAVKINQAPQIDGNLDDVAWNNVPGITDFIQNFPSVGQPATQKTVVKIVYDNTAIYIGAYLYDDPLLIRKQITARDEEQYKDLDYFSVFFDTYNDHQNGFQFLVTSSNVQTDTKLGSNFTGSGGEYGDRTWDAVWDSKTSMKKDGWVIEMRIPYISLRFAKKDVQDWGLQLLRFVRRNNETSFWNPVDPNINGFVNQFGAFTNLKNIKPPLRLSFSPYISTGYRQSPQANGTNEKDWLGSGGIDVKYGINESFTLDATVIPDFGQVISDNNINNLTPYEIRFNENRPFFTEGTEIFNKSGLFYSRRVGAMPAKYSAVRNFVAGNPDWVIHKNPSITRLYNATKFSGRTESKLGIGIFNAVTVPARAKIHNTISGKDSVIETEPLANYNIVVLDQALKGRSFITFTNTNVLRNGSSRDANVSALDFSFYDKSNTYLVKGTGRYSKIFTANSYDGYNSTLRFAKVSGYWQYFVQGNVESARYDPNDLGFLPAPNEVVISNNISYKQFKPTKDFINYSYSIGTRYNQLYKPGAYSDFLVNATAFWYLKNFWDITLTTGYWHDQHDYFVLGNPATYQRYVKRPAYGFVNLEGSTDSRKKLFFNYELLVADFYQPKNKDYHIANAGLRYRFGNKFTLDLSYRHEGETDYIISAGREMNGEPIVAFVNFTDVTTILSGIYNFTPRINLTLRARHYLSRVDFKRFANVDAKGNTIPKAGSTTYDNVNIFNVDAFLTWDFRLGSRLVLGYKNWLGDDEVVTIYNAKNSYFRNLGKIFDLRHGNEVTVRFIYFLDYNQLRKKR